MRAHRWTGGLVAALLVMAAARPASAESERGWVLDLQFGGYYPSIDEEFEDASPFATAFGSSDRMVTQLSIERLLFQRFGAFGVGASFGYAEFYGNGVFAEGTPDAGTASSDSTSFHVLPVLAQASYRFDWLAREAGVPLEPYGKLGAGYWLWWSDDGDATAEDGGILGWSAAAGLGLHLDTLDPRLASEFDLDVGVNDSTLFVEWSRWSAKNEDGFDLSDSMLSFGLSLKF